MDIHRGPTWPEKYVMKKQEKQYTQEFRDEAVRSNRGSQYAASGTRAMLSVQGVRQSMSRTGNCWDNAVSESFFGIV
jgi:transposase InsO family protein